MKFFLLGGESASLLNFRGELLSAVRNTGCSVSALARAGDEQSEHSLAERSIAFIGYPLQRNGMNFWRDAQTFFSLFNILRREKPDVVLAYTIKPIIWGGLALWFVPKPKFIALITGLGYAFQPNAKRGWLTALVSLLYRMALWRAAPVMFQNDDNLNEFVQRGIVPREKCHRVWGSGVDLNNFVAKSFQDGEPVFLGIGRLLSEKGIREYVEAARIVKIQYPNARFQWLGGVDPSPDGISLSQVQQWQTEGVLEYLGETSDVRPFLSACHIFVLPSYHEGMPRSTLEALATGRPIITTDVSGCRDTIIPSENGFLVPKANAEALAERMIWFIENPDKWEPMGLASRQLAESRFDVHKVNADMMRIMGLK